MPLLLLLLTPLVSAFAAEPYRILDPLAVPAQGDPASAVLTLARPARIPRIDCDLVIAGGGLGGVAAALAGARGGLHVCLTEPTRWLGGQMTSQGVSALDENRWIETTGATRTYLELRARIRAAYAASLKPEARAGHVNPGRCWVSALCFEPQVAVDVLDGMLAPYRANHALRVLLRTAPVAAARAGNRLAALVVYGFEDRRFTELRGKIFIDATELGDLLPLAGAAFRTGAESRAETGEPDAPGAPDPAALQSFTYPFVLARGAGPGIDVRRPADYENARRQFRFVIDYGQGRLLRYA
ncbi:MAG: FAD-dependent oxidoreductase, partial [Acidobacteriota bacterium]|nr:FAD-dependent oxidoreductase [Acidobacteriota bacterium]